MFIVSVFIFYLLFNLGKGELCKEAWGGRGGGGGGRRGLQVSREYPQGKPRQNNKVTEIPPVSKFPTVNG